MSEALGTPLSVAASHGDTLEGAEEGAPRRSLFSDAPVCNVSSIVSSVDLAAAATAAAAAVSATAFSTPAAPLLHGVDYTLAAVAGQLALPVSVADPRRIALSATSLPIAHTASNVRWQEVEGGMGGLARRFGSGSMSMTLAERDAQWTSALEDELDSEGGSGGRSLLMSATERPTQSFDSTGVEMASMSTPLSGENRGYILLRKMGWRENSGLGKHGDGLLEPVRLREIHFGTTIGLGKDSEYATAAKEATEARREMLSERIDRESVEERQQREAAHARQECIRSAREAEIQCFYCDVCDKQYVKVTEYENHLSSYDHHHKKRFKEMREAEKARAKANKGNAKPKKAKLDPAMVAAQQAAAAAAAGASTQATSSVGASVELGITAFGAQMSRPAPPGAISSGTFVATAIGANTPLATATADAPPTPPVGVSKVSLGIGKAMLGRGGVGRGMLGRGRGLGARMGPTAGFSVEEDD